MKILHTADWHLGAKTEGRSRLAEQRKILAQIEKMADEEGVSVVIISGDIFDQAVPTSEAEDLFYETLDNLTKKKNRVVIAIAGNHDDHKRLLAGVHFAKKHNAIIVGNLNPRVEKIETDKMLVESLAPGSIDISVKTARGVQRVVVACLPYPSEYRMDEEVKGEDYASKVAAWARLVCKGFRKDSVNILATHIMLVGSNRYVSDDSDVVRVGDINAVSKSDLPKADYEILKCGYGLDGLKTNTNVRVKRISFNGQELEGDSVAEKIMHLTELLLTEKKDKRMILIFETGKKVPIYVNTFVTGEYYRKLKTANESRISIFKNSRTSMLESLKGKELSAVYVFEDGLTVEEFLEKHRQSALTKVVKNQFRIIDKTKEG